MTTEDTEGRNAQPLLRVVRGTPDAGELAALVAVLTSRAAGGAAEAAPASRNGWTSRARAMRSIPAPGPGAWVASARTR